MSVKVVAFLVAIVVLLASSPMTTAQKMTCSVVYDALAPCISYFSSYRRVVPTACCGGVRSVLARGGTAADRRTTCGCIKTVAAGISGQDLSFAAAIPKKCGLSIPYKISPSTDCSKVM